MATSDLAGFVVRRERERAGLSQAALARRASISASYLNQIEHNRRALTPHVQLRLAEVLGIEAQALSADEQARTAAALVDLFAAQPELTRPSTSDLRAVADQMPDVADAMLRLGATRRRDLGRIEALESRLGDQRGPVASVMPYESVRDYFAHHRNYFDELDRDAEALADELGLVPRQRYDQLSRHLHSLGVDVLERPRSLVKGQRRFDPDGRTLLIADELRPDQKAFQAASQIALLRVSGLIDDLVTDELMESPVTRRLARIGLANYFAGALVLPYADFLAAAQRVRYDIDLLSQRCEVSFETICHRLSTLQRPDSRGVPFALVRVDRAGNISKRQSATPFHFSQSGGTCPLWTVYDSFSRPDELLRQVAEMPDGRAYLWVARTVTSTVGGFRAPNKTFAVGLGCDLAYASELVYSDGLDLDDPRARTPIGMGCRVCERPACPQRAFPFAGRELQVDENRAQLFPYVHEPEPRDPYAG
ncbi:short-chain fatty acyl-CoA regulator family protein [Demetria terragena]|uniref:short-chain fatty acyl-CoA regulator family protein n=1 Tax=Demetria terragena TaxID=63959 RepID=UPI0003785E9A|nr:short-chain fatty acyl-CoA regulator family protein [Demetria terragena]